MTKPDEKPEVNLLDLVPEPVLPHETAEDGRVVVFAHRFRSRWMRRLLEPRLKNPHVRVKLDEVGSAVWLACDGRATVGAIARGLRERFGEGIEPCHDRLAAFLRQLERARFIRFANLEECLRDSLGGAGTPG